MPELTKSEYQILISFFNLNQALTKKELIEKNHSLNSDTVASMLRELLNKGYLEIAQVKFSNTVLARAYRPRISLMEFLKDNYGEDAIKKLIVHTIKSTENSDLLNQLLDFIQKKRIAKSIKF